LVSYRQFVTTQVIHNQHLKGLNLQYESSKCTSWSSKQSMSSMTMMDLLVVLMISFH